MKRASVFVVVALLVAACESSPASPPDDQSQAPGQSEAQGASSAPSSGGGGGGGGTGNAALVETANAITDWCTMVPTDLVAALVPNANDPQSQTFPPLKCTVSNGVEVVEITYQSFVAAENTGNAPTTAGLGEVAWLEPDYPVDDAWLTVVLNSGEPAGTLYVEVVTGDGVDRGDDAIAIAQAVIAELQ
jgi:hypothetical protein